MTIHHNNEQQRHIEQLLDLFMAGESTLAQEQELARYFATHDVEGDWAVYKQMFAYFDRGMSAQPVPAAQCRKLRLWPWITAAAAALALALGVTLALVHSKPATAPVTARIEQPHPMPAVTVPATAAAPQRSVAAQAASPRTLARAAASPSCRAPPPGPCRRPGTTGLAASLHDPRGGVGLLSRCRCRGPTAAVLRLRQPLSCTAATCRQHL